jgi:hypothetical protein
MIESLIASLLGPDLIAKVKAELPALIDNAKRAGILLEKFETALPLIIAKLEALEEAVKPAPIVINEIPTPTAEAATAADVVADVVDVAGIVADVVDVVDAPAVPHVQR